MTGKVGWIQVERGARPAQAVILVEEKDAYLGGEPADVRIREGLGVQFPGPTRRTGRLVSLPRSPTIAVDIRSLAQCDFRLSRTLPGHEHAYRIRPFCSHSNGCLLRIGSPSPFLHPPIRILLRSWLRLRLPARCVAIRTGRTGMVGNCGGKVVVRSETENAALRVDAL
jgi:hypothetical protein